MGETKVTPLEAENRVLKFFTNVYARLVEEMEKKYGKEGADLAYDAYRYAVRDSCVPHWKKFTKLDAEAYADWLLDDLMEGYDFEIIEKTPNSVRLKFSSCPFAIFFRAIGKEKIGQIYCDVDYDMIKDFNETTGGNLGFERTKTLMEGHDCCNHHIFVKK